MPSLLPLQDHIAKTSSLAVKYRTLSAQFGDGYEQTADDGINSKVVTWDVTYNNLNEDKADTLIAFLDNVRGSTSFYATPRGESQQLWRLVPESLKISHVAVSNIDGEVYRTLSFQLKKAY